MFRLHANTTSFYIRDLSICGFWYEEGPGTNPLWIPRGNCVCGNQLMKNGISYMI